MYECLTEILNWIYKIHYNRTASSEFGTYRLCEQRRFRRACASAQSRQNLRCSLIQGVSQEEPSDRKPDPWPLWMAEHAQLKFVMTECSKTQIQTNISISQCLYLYFHLCQIKRQKTNINTIWAIYWSLLNAFTRTLFGFSPLFTPQVLQKQFSNNNVCFSFHVTLKHHLDDLDDLKTITGQGLDAVSWGSSGLQLRKVWFFF